MIRIFVLFLFSVARRNGQGVFESYMDSKGPDQFESLCSLTWAFVDSWYNLAYNCYKM